MDVPGERGMSTSDSVDGPDRSLALASVVNTSAARAGGAITIGRTMKIKKNIAIFANRFIVPFTSFTSGISQIVTEDVTIVKRFVIFL